MIGDVGDDEVRWCASTYGAGATCLLAAAPCAPAPLALVVATSRLRLARDPSLATVLVRHNCGTASRDD